MFGVTNKPIDMKGYKVFNSDWTCKGFQYKVGETYTHEGKISLCKSGFHACKNAVDCFNYYSFDPNNKVAEVSLTGDLIHEEKKDNKDAYTCGGYLKTCGYKEAWRKAYDNAADNDIESLKALPNFDADVFEKVTGIKVK